MLNPPIEILTTLYVGMNASSDDTQHNHPSLTLWFEEYKKITSDEVKAVLVIVFFFCFTGVISVMGTVANAINIAVFLKQGFKDSVNISLLGLAVSDLGSLTTRFWMSACFSPWSSHSDIPFESKDIQYLTEGWLNACFARITIWITAFITFERCVCIALPFKVKQIITPRRTLYLVAGIFLVMFACDTPVFCFTGIGDKYFEDRNATVLGLVYTPSVLDIENVISSITVFSQLTAFIIVIICTIILIHNILLNSKWRHSARKEFTPGHKNEISVRDKKVVVMVTLISSIFIVCFLPSAVNMICMIRYSPDYSVVGREQNTLLVSWAIMNTLEATNNSVNIFVYYRMSSKFRVVLLALFHRDVINLHNHKLSSHGKKSHQKTRPYRPSI